MTRGDSRKAGFSTFDSVTTVPHIIIHDSSALADLVVRRLEDSMKFFGGIPDITSSTTGDASTGLSEDTSKSESQAGPEWIVSPAQIHVDVIVRTVVSC